MKEETRAKILNAFRVGFVPFFIIILICDLIISTMMVAICIIAYPIWVFYFIHDDDIEWLKTPWKNDFILFMIEFVLKEIYEIKLFSWRDA